MATLAQLAASNDSFLPPSLRPMADSARATQAQPAAPTPSPMLGLAGYQGPTTGGGHPGMSFVPTPEMPNGPGLAPALGVAAPGVPNYADEYQRAMTAASAGIANQFHMALSDIAQREGLAQQAVGQLPGQLNQVYSAGAANMMTGAASLDAAQKASGLNSFMGAGAQMAPLSAAMGENKATAMSSAPLLALAVKTQMANERAALEQQHQSALQSLAEQNLSHVSDQQKTAGAQQYQTGAANQQHQWDVQSQQNQLQQQMTLAQMANDSRVEPKTNMTIGEISQVRQNPLYTHLVNWIAGTAGDPTGNSRKPTLANIEKAAGGVPSMMKVIALEYPGLK